MSAVVLLTVMPSEWFDSIEQDWPGARRDCLPLPEVRKQVLGRRSAASVDLVYRTTPARTSRSITRPSPTHARSRLRPARRVALHPALSDGQSAHRDVMQRCLRTVTFPRATNRRDGGAPVEVRAVTTRSVIGPGVIDGREPLVCSQCAGPCRLRNEYPWNYGDLRRRRRRTSADLSAVWRYCASSRTFKCTRHGFCLRQRWMSWLR